MILTILKYLAMKFLALVVKSASETITYKDVVRLLTFIVESKGNSITNDDIKHLLDGNKT